MDRIISRFVYIFTSLAVLFNQTAAVKAWFNVWVKNQNQDVLIEDDSSQDYTDYAGGNLTMGLIYDRRLTHAEELKVSPDEVFSHDNQTYEIVWRFFADFIVKKGFTDMDYQFHHNDRIMENEGGAASRAEPGKPYVDYILSVWEEGTYTGSVGNLTATAHVYMMNDEEDMVVARKGTKKDLMYDGGPANTVKMWEVDGVPVEMMENEKFQENVNGTLTISDIDLGVGLKKIAIRLFFNRKDMNIFKQNVTGIPAYRTTLVTVPVLVFETVKRPDSTVYTVETKSWKTDTGLRLCHTENDTLSCVPLGSDGSGQLPMTSDCMLFIGNTNISACPYQESQESVMVTPKPPKLSLGWLILVAVLVVGLIVIAVVIFIIRKKKLLCFKDKKANTTGTELCPLNKEHKDKKGDEEGDKKDDVHGKLMENGAGGDT